MNSVSGFIYDVGLEDRDVPWKKTINRKTFSGTGRVPTIISSNDKQLIVYANQDHEINVYSIEKRKTIYKFTEVTCWINCLILSQDNKFLGSGSYDKSVRVWNLHLKELIFKFECTSYVQSVDFNRNCNFVVAGCSDGKIWLWDLTMKAIIKSIQAHNCHIVSLAFTEDSTSILSVSNDSTIKTFESSNLTQIKIIPTSSAKIWNANLKAHNNIIVLAFGDWYYRVFKIL
ncbi:hypothetical protein SteCoe_8748 [Stentor coeruleus]|uniref:Uncharacterized protein n=1 Tax=Stentor coeruleus TaxID=5963 RepID=A0A1R2CJF0_9CILI|nr:hypothetical protein SteCoe_8748 [Stentor coeruleus]